MFGASLCLGRKTPSRLSAGEHVRDKQALHEVVITYLQGALFHGAHVYCYRFVTIRFYLSEELSELSS